jgi:hypothetical protein
MDVDSDSTISKDSVESIKIKAHVEDWKIGKYRPKLFIEGILGKFDFSHVKVAYSTDFEVFMDDLSLNEPPYR